MYKIFLMLALVASLLVKSSFAQTSAQKEPSVLALYFSVRDALTAGKADIASVKATELNTALKGAQAKSFPEATKTSLQKNTEAIAASKNLKVQREAFSKLSADLSVIAKAQKLSTEALYEVYCPMKKSSWLSSEKEVKNPYYGAAMLTCGKVTGTL